MPGKKSYAESINKMKVMLAGIKANKETLEKRGVDDAFIAAFEELYANAREIDNEQEKLKADLKTKSAELDDAMKKALKMLSEAKKLTKLTIPKEQWKEFGIADKQ